MLIPYDSNALMGGDDNIATSPFTLVFKNLWVSFCGIIYECSYFNISFIGGNSGMYASTRMLYSMSKDKLAFHSFGKTNKYGVPYLSLFARRF